MVIAISDSVYRIDEGELRTAIETMRKTSREICARLIPGDQASTAREILDFALFEFMKNCLHGREIEIYELPLKDGSILLMAHNLIGSDLLSPEMCGHLGELAIVNVVGQENYHVIRDEGSYSTFLRIVPDEIAARF